MRTRIFAPTALASLVLLGLSACGGGGEPQAAVAESISVNDAWIKATEEGMSAAFGGMKNSGSADANVVAADAEVAEMVELHETVENESGEMIMRKKEGGFTIGAGQTLTLKPGGDHIMLMELPEPLEAGDEVTFTLTFSDDSTMEFTAPVKAYSGANENYQGGGGEGK